MRIILITTASLLMLCTPSCKTLEWENGVDCKYPENAINAGVKSGQELMACRGNIHSGFVLGGELADCNCNVGFNNREKQLKDYQVLAGNAKVSWVTISDCELPEFAVTNGIVNTYAIHGKVKTAVCRGEYEAATHVGVYETVSCNCIIGYGGKAVELDSFEIMVSKAFNSEPLARDTLNGVVYDEVGNIYRSSSAKKGEGGSKFVRNGFNIGIMDATGETLLACEYFLPKIQFDGGLYLDDVPARTMGKWGVMDYTGKFKIACEYEYLEKAYTDGKPYFIYQKEGEIIVLDDMLKEVNRLDYNYLHGTGYDGLMVVSDDNKTFKCINFITGETFENSTETIVMHISGKFGLFHPTDGMVLPAIYERLDNSTGPVFCWTKTNLVRFWTEELEAKKL